MKISSITEGPRQSNFELLRIIAMLMVLIVHVDFFATGQPSLEDFDVNPLGSFTKTLIESISIVCVNVFILISGWFGIKPSLKGLCNFIFQCLYIYVIVYSLLIACGFSKLSVKGIAACFCFIRGGSWFVLAYLGLYILSPILNSFIENTNRVTYRNILIAFYIFQTIWGWTNATSFISYGSSVFSFIGLYLLARYVKIYGIWLLTAWGGASYIICVLINTFMYYYFKKYGIPIGIFSYVNPFVVLESLSLLLFFNNIKVNTNRIINWIAKSSFAVYLVHMNENIVQLFISTTRKIYDSTLGLESILYLGGLCLLIYMTALVLDQPRKWLWKNLISKVYSTNHYF